MHFRVEHETLYRYSAPVAFAPHLLRLHPRGDGAQILSHSLLVVPRPVERVDVVDAFGNRVTRVAFDGEWQELRITSCFELVTRGAERPLAPAAPLPLLPWPLHADDDLEPYRGREAIDPSVVAFAQRVAAEAAQLPEALAPALCRTLYDMMDRHVRAEGPARSAATTLATRTGACRDITVLFLAACRSLGLPARFVSGYQSREKTPDGQRHLHAWAEVHLPGVGWSGWDATHGVPAADGHIALCAAPDQSATMPVEGAYYGPARTATLDCSLRVATD